MAEGTSVKQNDVVCRFFSSSGCRDGDKCLFSHDRSRRTPDLVCRFYLRGICAYGQNCRYDHVKINKEGSSKSHLHNDSHSAGPSGHSSSRDVPCNFSESDTVETNLPNPRFDFLSLNTDKNEASATNGPSYLSNWVHAPEFVPKYALSYAEMLKTNTVSLDSPTELCPYLMNVGLCPNETECPYVHGDVCELCCKACLHPYDDKQRKLHMEQCVTELEQDMELSFAVQRSMDKTCGVCMDVVLEKEPMSERRFGILEKCNHVYCLSCIRKWRQLKHNKSDEGTDIDLNPIVTKACPECRVSSDFVIPSSYFVDTEEEKSKLIADYKKALGQKDCKYFKKGEGICPFGGSCFYLHAKRDGTKVELPVPSRRQRLNQDGEFDNMEQFLLSDFINYREELGLVDYSLISSSSDDSSDSDE